MRRRLAASCREEGFTLVELLVASAMGVVVMAAVTSLMISAIKVQPKITDKAQSISDARYVLERLTKEIRNGIAVSPGKAKADEVSFTTYVRRTSCGGTGTLASNASAIPCQVTYKCTTTVCTRTESPPGSYTGASTTIFKGISSSSVFSYVPNATSPTFIRITLRIPDADGIGNLTVSDGASMRNATLDY